MCGVMLPGARIVDVVVVLTPRERPDPTYTTFVTDGLTGAADEPDLTTFKQLCVR